MILDQILLDPKVPIPPEILIKHFVEELDEARRATPHPHLTYREGLSLPEQMLISRIAPSQLGASTDEIMALEFEGAVLAARQTIARAVEGDLLIENIPALIKSAHTIIKRYKLSLQKFGVTSVMLDLRERAYWFTSGRFYTQLLRETEGVRQSTDVRIWFFHEIRLARTHATCTNVDLGLDRALCLFATRRIQHELRGLRETFYDPNTEQTHRDSIAQHHNILIAIIRPDLEEFAS